MKYFLFVVLTAICLSCEKKSKDDNQTFVVDDKATEVETVTLFSDFQYISLETNRESLFGKTSKLARYNKKFFLLDKSKRKKVFVFSEEGDFLYTVGRIGKGPEEYMHIEDFAVNKKNGNVIILSFPSTLMIYNSEGAFLKRVAIKTKALVNKICWYDGGLVCSTNHMMRLNGEDAKQIFILDRDFNIKRKLFNTSSTAVSVPQFTGIPVQYTDNTLYYYDFLSNDFFYKLENESFKTLKFDFGQRKMPDEYFGDTMQFFKEQPKYCFMLDMAVLDDKLIVAYANQGQKDVLLYDFKSRKIEYFHPKGWFPEFVGVEGDKLYTVVQANMIIEGRLKLNAKSRTKFPLEIESNPVIMSFKLK